MESTDTGPGITKLAQRTATWIYLAIYAFILALVVRTWLVMGLIAPLTVSGNSMAPTLVGPHIGVDCPRCHLTLCIGVQQGPEANPVHCPYCQEGRLDWTRAGGHPGTRLWIDRTTTQWRLPRRWEVVVFNSPWQNDVRNAAGHWSDGATALCTKRVLGLPGEQVRLVAGDVWIDGQLQVKTLAEQRLLRQLVRKRPNPLSLPGDNSNAENESLFPTNRPFTDDTLYNGHLSRKLNLVHDFMFSAHLTCRGRGQLAWTIDDGRRPLCVRIKLADGTVQLLDHGRQLVLQSLSKFSRQRLAHGEVTLELSTFDRQLLLAIDRHVELQYALQGGVLPAGTMEPFAVTATNLMVTLRAATLWRDIYYAARPAGLSSWGVFATGKGASTDHQEACWQLASDELFLVGDNVPVSIDSRVWPQTGMPRHMLVGGLLGSR